jgi:hypothetical protein
MTILFNPFVLGLTAPGMQILKRYEIRAAALSSPPCGNYNESCSAPSLLLGGTGHVISALGRENQVIRQNEVLAVSVQTMLEGARRGRCLNTKGQWA